MNSPSPPNPLDRLLRDELNRMLDRIAAATPSGLEVLADRPDLSGLIEAVEDRLTALRLGMLEDYRRWGEALEECADLWALAALGGPEPAMAVDLEAA
jgi:hypothetical protein